MRRSQGDDQAPTGDLDRRRRRDAEARLRDLSVLLPLIGAVLLASPLVRAFARPLEIAGVPMIVVYILGVWVALIVGAVLLARARRPSPPPEP